MRIAVAAVQGAFVEHEKMLEAMGIEVIELRKLEDLSQPFAKSAILGSTDCILFFAISSFYLPSIKSLGLTLRISAISNSTSKLG